MSIRLAALALALAAATALGAQETHVQDPAQSKALNTQAYIQLLSADLSAKKEQIVKDTMQLNEKQAATFWPIYHEYQAEQNKLDRRKAGDHRGLFAELCHDYRRKSRSARATHDSIG